MTDFDAFWNAFPRKVGKLAARKAYEKARKSNGATQAELLAGIARYIQHKPGYADFCHPASWLNAGRWMDSYDAPVQAPVTSTRPKYYGWWIRECDTLHASACADFKTHVAKLALEKTG